jgi:hypothetical protein
MSTMLSIGGELSKHVEFRNRLLAEFPEIDEITLYDSLSGVSNLEEALAATLLFAHYDEMRAGMLDAEIEKLRMRAERFQARADKARARVREAMEEAGLKRIVTHSMTATLRPTQPAVIITDEKLLPPDYLKHPPPKPDKTLIKQAIKDGFEVPGAMLSNGGMTLAVRHD